MGMLRVVSAGSDLQRRAGSGSTVRNAPTDGFCDANLITLDRDGGAYYQKDAAGTIQPNVVRAFPGRRARADRSAWQFGVMDESLSSVVQW